MESRRSKVGVSQDNPDPFPSPEYVHLYDREDAEEPAANPEQELREGRLLALPGVLHNYRETVLEQMRQYRPFSYSHIVFYMLDALLSNSEDLARKAAAIVRGERESNVE